MVIVWGSRLYGKVDVVPGFFHVATRFGHLYYLPLIPTQSFVVVAQQGDAFHGVPIPLSGKSILIAWARAFLLIFAFVSAMAALVNLQGRDPAHWLWPAAMSVGAAVLFGFATWHRVGTHASLSRACRLGELVGLNEAGMAELYRVYGEAGARGFEVKPSAAAAAGAPFPSQMPKAKPVVPQGAVAAQAARPVVARRKPEDLSSIPLEPMDDEPAPAQEAPKGQQEWGLR